MKKRFYVFSMLAAGMLLAGCSDELEGGQDGPNVVEGETGYVKVTISLPSTMGTRAENDDFEDGLGSEWAVKSGIIAYFNGVNEEDAVFVGAYNLPGTWNVNSPTDDAITATQTLTAQAPLLKNNTNSVYALVILNGHSNVISMNNNTHSLTIGSTEYVPSAEAPATALKLATLRTKLTGQDIADYTGTDGFTMLNAPLATEAVTSTDHDATVEILQPITIYETEAEANANSATVIHLERVMAKVTLTGFTEKEGELRKDIDDLPEGYKGYAVLEGWTLDVTNKSTKLLHDVTGYGDWFDYFNEKATVTNSNRFVAAAEPYRIYWSVDGNYDGSNYGTANPNTPTDTRYSQEFNYIADVTPASDIEWKEKIGSDNPLYCFENTFDAANMKEAQTTRIVLTGKYYFTQDGGAEGASTNSNVDAEDPSFFVIGSGDAAVTYTIANFIKQVNTKVSGFLETTWNPEAEVNGGTYDTVEGLATLLGKSATDDAAAAGLQTILREFGSVKYYKDGQVFYHVSRIEHFGDEYTPWTDGEDGERYDYKDNKHLGRYGVVRNNWYELNITAITSPGEPEIPDTPDTPDDEETGYVKAEIRILAWAKRTQDVEL